VKFDRIDGIDIKNTYIKFRNHKISYHKILWLALLIAMRKKNKKEKT